MNSTDHPLLICRVCEDREHIIIPLIHTVNPVEDYDWYAGPRCGLRRALPYFCSRHLKGTIADAIQRHATAVTYH